MKKLFLLLFILSSGFAYSQSTTQDEYLYMTKGYAQSLADGLGIKAGYTIADKGSYVIDYGSYKLSAHVIALMRTDNSTAGDIVAVTDPRKNITKYFAVPAKNSDQSIWNNTVTDIRAAYGADKDKSGYEIVMYAVMHVVGQ